MLCLKNDVMHRLFLQLFTGKVLQRILQKDTLPKAAKITALPKRTFLSVLLIFNYHVGFDLFLALHFFG